MSDQIIRRFQMNGMTSSPLKRRELEIQLLMQMHEEGYAQVIDIDSTFKTDYQVEKDIYDFVLTIQGVYVGEDSWDTVVTNGRNIQRIKSGQ